MQPDGLDVVRHRHALVARIDDETARGLQIIASDVEAALDLPDAATGPDTPATASVSGSSGPDSGGGGARRTVARPARPRLGAQVVELLKARGGTLEGGQRGLAKMLGLSKSRANELLKHLAAAGEVVVSTSRTGTRAQLASAA